MLPAFAIADDAPFLTLIAEQLHIEAEALESAEDDLQRTLLAGGVLALSRIAFEEAQRLTSALLATSPDGDTATSSPQPES